MSNERNLGDYPIDENTKAVAPLVVEYFDWLSGNGGRDPEELLNSDLTAAQKELLRERVSDVNFVFAITSPIRLANEDGDLDVAEAAMGNRSLN